MAVTPGNPFENDPYASELDHIEIKNLLLEKASAAVVASAASAEQ